MIETKFKSGTVFADAASPTWKTSALHGEGAMRNALWQVKNTAKILRREFRLAGEVIPLVAIVGKNVVVSGGPSNVVAAADLIKTIQAFEQAGKEKPALAPDAIVEILKAGRRHDRAARDKHMARIREKRIQEENQVIVRTASID